MEQMASESIDHNHGTPRMQLFINDARREFEESGKVRNLPFWVYLVTCKTTLPKFHEAADAKTQDGVTVLKVWRRYSDFQWLREKLFKSFGGFIIPPIPEKDFFGTLDKVADLVAGPEMDDWRMNDFVSLRLGALNKFVHALARSSVAESDLVRNFLCLSKHEEWNTYKAHVSETIKQHHVSYTSSNPVSTVKNMFGKVKKMVNKNKSPEGSSGESGGSAKPSSVAHLDPRVARINAQSHEFEAHFAKLYTASMLLLTRGKTRQKAAPVVFDGNAENAKEVVPIWLLSVGHKVCGVEGNVGTVRFVGLVNEVSHVGIEWTEAVGHCDGVAADGQRYFQTEHNHASFVLPQVVFYPPSGVSDPAILAAREASSQIETHLLPYGSRAQQLLTELVDMTYFWRMYAIGVNEVIAYLADLEASRAHVQLEVNKETRPEKLCILREKLENVTKVQKEHTSTFCEQFQKYFQPEHRRSMRKILELYVAVQKELCVIGASWNVKIRPVVSLLDVTRNQTTE